MPKNEGASKSGRQAEDRGKSKASPLSPAYDKKLDGPNRPST
ncbi:hypothetical protein [Cohnella cellulosilytica]|uniref:Uncharacterized protein n=1 Tax=Cohnella cellulosilytica TaxID=986710 RepID=A0ABW2FLP6_9BACL